MPEVTSSKGRRFTCFPAAILVFLVNDDEEVLLLSKSPERWEIVAGGIEGNESILDSAHRELKEELGSVVKCTPLGIVHAHTFHYDEVIKDMISIHYVMHYHEGDVIPSDDMEGANYAWWSLDKIRKNASAIAIPEGQVWIFERAIDLLKNYKDSKVPFEYVLDGSSNR